MTSRRGITTMSYERSAVSRSGSVSRKISRSRRLAALRWTAPPRRRDATTPRRSTPRSFGSAKTVMLRLATRRPRSCTATNSARERSRTCRPKDDDMNASARRALLRGNRQALAALGATALKDDPAILGGHTHTKAMSLATPTPIGLVGTLHRKQLSITKRGVAVND